ncbi:MAG: hypothetical protein KDK34_11925, partial [Leptospiraceae bacterium]|nr:hypothetical protein [Leptospiraceae bacterium]
MFVLGLLALPSMLSAQVWVPPGYADGENLESSGWGLSTAYQEVNDDIYITVTPLIELPLWKFRVGLTVPQEVLVLDREPKTGEDVPSIRPGTFDTWEDYLKLIQYVKYGTHLFYDPDDLFNWSFHYGKMTDGWMGHKTVIFRYANNYDPTIFRAGLMADINGNAGGIEHFSSDIWRKEVVGWRGYIRPVGLVTGVHDTFFVHGGFPSPRQVALSVRENRDPRINGGVYYQEAVPDHGAEGRLGQQFHGKIGQEVGETSTVKFVEQTNPVTGETEVRAVEGDPLVEEQKEREGDEWGPSFWSRFAIGYFQVRDMDAPLNLETDGSGNLVVDPETLRPRADDDETLTIQGWDAEFRLSPFDWLDLTPYADFPEVKDLEGSEARHYGIDSGFNLGPVQLTFRPEYREHSSNYIPNYFDQYHVLERTIYNPGGDGDSTNGSGSSSTTKLAYLKSLPSDGEMVKGYFVQLIMDWLQTLVIDATYEDYDGPDNSQIFVGVYVPAIADIFFNGYYN